ncbi:hypothetical protein [Alkalihalobacterium elongatum]|uniref:hypothetical protein n=1 Tax=Alkalihalobacterium elongatum TaxID=2675466 RepID=UPI001C1F93AC|nr:hypothetical protein [Alkalihalobacterium elongatum]
MRKIKVIIASAVITSSLIACSSIEEGSSSNDEMNANKEEIAQDKADVKLETDEEPTESQEEDPVTTNDDKEETDGIDHHHELPYEWKGSYEFSEGTYTLQLNKNKHGDETMLIAVLLENSNIKDLDHHAAHLMEAPAEEVNEDETFKAIHEYIYLLPLKQDQTTFTFSITETGRYALFLEHDASEFKMQIFEENGEEIEVQNEKRYEGHGHDHDH